MADLAKYIREVPDFPKPGILFYDLTTLLANPKGLKEAVDAMIEPYPDKGITQVVAIESRGFIFGSVVAYQLGAGLTLVRKPGKLPSKTVSESYELEYGTDTLEMHEDALGPADKVLIVDDLLATGGTMEAVARMVSKTGAEIVGIAFAVELDFLNGRNKLEGYDVHTLQHYAS